MPLYSMINSSIGCSFPRSSMLPTLLKLRFSTPAISLQKDYEVIFPRLILARMYGLTITRSFDRLPAWMPVRIQRDYVVMSLRFIFARMQNPGMDAGFDVVSLFANSQRIKNAKDGIFLRITIPPTLRRRRNLRRRL